MFAPNFTLPAKLDELLERIEMCKDAVAHLPVTVHLLTSLRESARLMFTHYSTQIEGNQLTQQQVQAVLQGGTFPNRVRDEREVKNYYRALDFLEGLINEPQASFSEKAIKTLHGLVMDGKRRPTPYRDGQNVIRDSISGAIIYMPPEAKDVSALMSDMVAWINEKISNADLPAPVVAAIAHYQFATIHPYYDGNGRTARLLTNLVLHKAGYGLKGIYSLEEYYARNLPAYYKALAVGKSHNYYLGRVEANIGKWIMYFCEGMADAFAKVHARASEATEYVTADHAALLWDLDRRQKRVLSLFIKHKFITTREVAELLELHVRTALNLCQQWVEAGFIIAHATAKKSRKYELAAKWHELIADKNAMRTLLNP